MSQAAYWNQMYANAIDQSEPSQRYRPSLSIDGDQWCALYGENLQDGVAGFGDSPGAAFWAFDRASWTKLKSGVAGVSPTPTLLKEKSMLDGMKAARDALVEYYRAEAPVMVMIEASITEAEEYNRAYELLFKENGKLRSALAELTALVRGECGALLDEDRGGSASLSMEIDDLLGPNVK